MYNFEFWGNEIFWNDLYILQIDRPTLGIKGSHICIGRAIIVCMLCDIFSLSLIKTVFMCFIHYLCDILHYLLCTGTNTFTFLSCSSLKWNVDLCLNSEIIICPKLQETRGLAKLESLHFSIISSQNDKLGEYLTMRSHLLIFIIILHVGSPLTYFSYFCRDIIPDISRGWS